MSIAQVLRKNSPVISHEAMTLVDHLSELRRRLIVCAAAFAGSLIVVYLLYGPILRFLEHPYCSTLKAHQACALYVTGPIDAFAIRLNVTGYGGLILASPVILFELWQFVNPGLHTKEKRYALPFVAATTGLFVAGAGVAWLTFPHVMAFLHGVGGPGIQDIFTPDKYIGLILSLMAIFGLTFEFPVLLVALEIANVLTPAKLVRFRRIAIVLIVIVSAVITPSSDPFSMLAMAVPMLLFYEISIVLGRLIDRKRGSQREAPIQGA